MVKPMLASVLVVFSLSACQASEAKGLEQQILTATEGQDTMTNNKRIVESFFQTLTSGDFNAAFEVVSDSVKWWVPGGLPFSGEKTKQEYMAIAHSIQKGFPDGFSLTVKSMIGEGDTVAAEVESNGTYKNGRAYNNKYHFLIQLTEGKIERVKEYMDTQHLAQLIGP